MCVFCAATRVEALRDEWTRGGGTRMKGKDQKEEEEEGSRASREGVIEQR